jgi:hypothetical protein
MMPILVLTRMAVSTPAVTAVMVSVAPPPSWWLLVHGGLVWVIDMDIASLVGFSVVLCLAHGDVVSLMEICVPWLVQESFATVMVAANDSLMVVRPSRLPFDVWFIHIHPSCGPFTSMGSTVAFASTQRGLESRHREVPSPHSFNQSSPVSVWGHGS